MQNIVVHNRQAESQAPSCGVVSIMDTIPRLTASYEPHYERFRFTETRKTFTQQYAGIYFSRLAQLRKTLEQAAKRKWDKPIICERVLDLPKDEECVILGTVYKEMPLRPSILEEYTRDDNLPPVPPRENCVSENDYAIIEDESGRVTLSGKIKKDMLATGMILAARGAVLPTGEFFVRDICLPGFAPQKPLSQPRKGYVALVSGLYLGSAQEVPLRTELLVEYLTGALGSAVEQRFAAEIVRVIVAGNTVATINDNEPAAFRNILSFKFAGADTTSMPEADSLFSRIASSCHLDVMTGPTDPANFTLPQQPLHPCLFPRAAKLSTFHPVTNPYECDIVGVRFLGTSGQPVDDLHKYTVIPRREEILYLTLKCRHIAPTAPDTLATYPFMMQDPYVMTECPHVYFAGNQPQFAADLRSDAQGQRTQVICVPSFAKTGTIVLVDLDTLNCHPITFSLPDAPASAVADNGADDPMSI